MIAPDVEIQDGKGDVYLFSNPQVLWKILKMLLFLFKRQSEMIVCKFLWMVLPNINYRIYIKEFGNETTTST